MATTAPDWWKATCGALGVGLAVLSLPVGSAAAEGSGAVPVASEWTREQASRVRLIAGVAQPAGEPAGKLYAGLEIELDEGWKTYWRNPGSSGVPPRIVFDGSENLARAELLFPAPVRFKDPDGDTIGYKTHVVLPIALTPKDASKPIVLKAAAEFGLCREICVPVQPELGLTVLPNVGKVTETGPLQAALDRVPRPAPAHPDAPRLEQVAPRLTGDTPQVVIEARFPGRAEAGDIFLEAPDGLWMPLPQASGTTENGARRFVVDLTDGADVGDLKGRRIRVTLVGSDSQSETEFHMVEAK